MKLTLPGDMAGVRKTMQDLAGGTLFATLPQDLRENAEIVLAEVLNNIVEHAYADRSGDITLALDLQPQGLLCQINDKGAPMPDLALPEGQLQPLDRIDDLPEGGFGWFLIRSLTEDLTYRHDAEGNCLSFRLLCEQSAA